MYKTIVQTNARGCEEDVDRKINTETKIDIFEFSRATKLLAYIIRAKRFEKRALGVERTMDNRFMGNKIGTGRAT